MERIEEPTALQFAFSRLFPDVVLASSSPNRKLLLEKGGTLVTVFKPEADESTEGLGYEEAMAKNARVKMEAYLASPAFDGTRPAISADTLVLIDGELLGKPKDEEDAAAMLRHLSGRRQTVLTGCGLFRPGKGVTILVDKADVVFKDLTEEDIKAYLATGESLGAAGAYRLQKTGWKLVERIDGDWATVVGLPLEKLIELAEA